MNRPDSYLDVAGAAIGGGFRVALLGARPTLPPLVFDTAADVAAAALLLDLPVLTANDQVRLACRARAVRLLPLEVPA